MTKHEILLAQKEFLFPAVFHYYKEPLVISHAKDQYVWDADGNQYLDFFGGIVTVSVGHCNSRVNERVHAQIDRLEHVSTVFANEPQVALARKLASITPGGALRKSFFTNSGTEANETAILAARCYTGSTEIIALRHSYHGRSSGAMTLTGPGLMLGRSPSCAERGPRAAWTNWPARTPPASRFAAPPRFMRRRRLDALARGGSPSSKSPSPSRPASSRR